MLMKAGVKTNIHYILHNESIDEAIQRLKEKTFPEGINAIVFLLHKPIGLGTTEKMIDLKNEKFKALVARLKLKEQLKGDWEYEK